MKRIFEKLFLEDEHLLVNWILGLTFLIMVGMFIHSIVTTALNPAPEPGTCGVCIRKCAPFVVSSCHLESEGVSCACDVEKRE